MDNVVRVSGQLSIGNCINHAKQRLKNAPVAEFHAVGSCITTALKAAIRLQELKYVSTVSFTTSTAVDNNHRLYKVVIQLTKSPEFDQVNEEFMKSRPSS